MKLKVITEKAPEVMQSGVVEEKEYKKRLTWFLEKTPKVLLHVLVFLIPLWFLPVTQDIFAFQKQALLIILLVVATIAWLATVIHQGELKLRVNWLFIPVVAVVLVNGLSTIFSLWQYGSFWGWQFNVSDSFITVLFFALLYFLVSHAVKDNKELFSLFFTVIASACVAGIFTILQLYQIFIIPFSFAKSVAFNTLGGVNSVAMLAAVLIPISLMMGFALKKSLKWWFWFFTALLFIIVLFINFKTAWLTLIVELCMLLIFGIWGMKKKIESGWLPLPMVLLVVSLLFLIFNIAIPGSPASPIEVLPSKTAEVGILWNAIKQNPLLGTGPGTFVFDYAKYHQVSLNQTIFWNTRFNSGSSAILDIFITEGIAGFIALISLAIVAAFLSTKKLITSKSDSASWIVLLAVLASFAGLITTFIFYYSNFTLLFLFWFLLGALGMLVSTSEKKISLVPPSPLAIFSSFAFLLVLIFGISLLFVGGQKYVAEVQYLKAGQAISSGDNQKGIAKILSAVNLNSSLDVYWQDLSQLYLTQANQILADNNLSEDQKKQQSQVAVSNAVTSANQAVAVNPANVANWNVRGFIYRNLIGIQGADDLAVESYNKAASLESASPFSVTELARVYFTKAQGLAGQKDTASKYQEALDKAMENLNKAITLKSDYAPAHYLIALVYDQEGKSDEVIAKLAETTRLVPNDLGLALQLGVLYYQRNDLSKAQAEFERAKSVDQNYSNARYMLGLVYDKQGQKSKAIEEFKKVLKLNPDNDQVKKILDNLNNGKPALSGIQVGEPPIQENPPEIQSKSRK